MVLFLKQSYCEWHCNVSLRMLFVSRYGALPGISAGDPDQDHAGDLDIRILDGFEQALTHHPRSYLAISGTSEIAIAQFPK